MVGLEARLGNLGTGLILGLFSVVGGLGCSREDANKPEAVKSKNFGTESALLIGRTAISSFYQRYNRYPKDLAEIHNSGIIDSMEPLKDQWGRYIVYEKGSEGFKLYSMGPDGTKKTSDDVME